MNYNSFAKVDTRSNMVFNLWFCSFILLLTYKPSNPINNKEMAKEITTDGVNISDKDIIRTTIYNFIS